MTERVPVSLPLARVLSGAITLPWNHRIAVMRTAGVPLLAVVAGVLAWDSGIGGDSKIASWIVYVVFACALTWLAIRTHRLVLANAWQPEPAFGEWNSRRFAYFVGALVALWLLYQLITVFLMGVLVNVVIRPRYVLAGETRTQPTVDLQWIGYVASVLSYWIIGRLSLLLPAIAIDLEPDIAGTWRRTRGNAWKLAVIVGVLPWVLQLVTDALYRDGATMFEAASIAVLIGVGMIVQVTALSLTYFELTRSPEPPPTHPPG